MFLFKRFSRNYLENLPYLFFRELSKLSSKTSSKPLTEKLRMTREVFA